jgi:hypothetical protein
MNIYFCPDDKPGKGTIIIRFSDEGSDYWSISVGDYKKGSIMRRKED